MYPVWCFVIITIILLYFIKSKSATLQEEFIDLASNQESNREINRIKKIRRYEPMFR